MNLPRPIRTLFAPLAAVALLAAAGQADAEARITYYATPTADHAVIWWGVPAPPPSAGTAVEGGVAYFVAPDTYPSASSEIGIGLISSVSVDGESGVVRIGTDLSDTVVSVRAEGLRWVVRATPPADMQYWFVDLEDLGYRSDLTVWGTRDEIDIWFPSPGAPVVPGGSHVLVSYEGRDDLKEGSALTTVVAGEPTQTLSLEGGGTGTARIPLTAIDAEQFEEGPLPVTFIPYLYSRPGTCNSLATADDWFRLDRTSGVRYLLRRGTGPSTLDRFLAPGPYAFSIEAADVGTREQAQALVWLAAGIDRLDVLSRPIDVGPPMAGRRHVVVGTPESIAQRVAEGDPRWTPVAGAVAALEAEAEAIGILNILPTTPPTLAVVARDGAALEKTVSFLLSSAARQSAQGPLVLVRDAELIEPSDANPSLVSFADLEVGPFDLRGGKRRSTEMVLNRADLGAFPRGVQARFDIIHSPVPPEDRAFLHVLVNDNLLASYALGQEMSIQPDSLEIPDWLLFRSNRIRFELEYNLFVKDCGGALPEMRLQIPSSGYFEIAAHDLPAHLTFDALPEALRGNLTLRLPAAPSAMDVALAVSIVRTLQNLPGAQALVPRVEFGGWGDPVGPEIWIVPEGESDALSELAPFRPEPPFRVVGPEPTGVVYDYADGESLGVMQVFTHQLQTILALSPVGPEGKATLLDRLDRGLPDGQFGQLSGMLAFLPAGEDSVVSVMLQPGETVVDRPGRPPTPTEEFTETWRPGFFVVAWLLIILVILLIYSRTRSEGDGDEPTPGRADDDYFSDAEPEDEPEEPGFRDVESEGEEDGDRA